MTTPALSTDRPGASFPPAVQAWRSTVVLSLIGFILSMDVMLTALLMEPLKRGMGISDVQLGLLQGTAFGLSFGICSLPLGRLIDRTNRVRLLSGAVALWIVAMAGSGLGASFAILVGCRIVLGAVAALLLPAAISLIADFHPPERRSLTTSMFAVGQAVGQSFGALVGGKAYDALGHLGHGLPLAPWRVLYLGAAALALPLLPLLFLIREPARQELAGPARTVRQAVSDLWAHRTFLGPLLLGAMFAQVGTQAATIWATPVLIRVHHLTPGQFAVWFSMVMFVCSILGALGAGQLAELGRRRAGRTGVVIPAVVAAVLLAPLSLFALAPSVPLFALLFGLNLIMGGVVVTVVMVAIAMNIPNEIRGLAVGLNIFVAAAIGTAGGPPLIAFVSRLMGGEAHLAASIAAVAVPCTLIAAGFFALALRAGRSVSV